MEQRNLNKYKPFVEAYENGEITYRDGALYRVKKRVNQSKVVDLSEPKLMRMNDSQRYFRVHINGKTCYEHIVIYAIFNGIDSLTKFETIDHLDGDKTNNKIDNLEGVSIEENNKRAKEKGLLKTFKGLKNGNAKLTDEEIKSIRETYATGKYSQKKVAEMFNISQSHVNSIVNNKKRS